MSIIDKIKNLFKSKSKMFSIEEIEKMVINQSQFDLTDKTVIPQIEKNSLAIADAAFQNSALIWGLLINESQTNSAHCLTFAEEKLSEAKKLEKLVDMVISNFKIFAEIKAYKEEIAAMTARGLNDCVLAYVSYHTQKDPESPDNIHFHKAGIALLQDTLTLFDDIDHLAFEDSQTIITAIKGNIDSMESEIGYYFQQFISKHFGDK